ncbi:two-component sensor histidine kinase [Candidatus Moduliflexus flocculans]|uniref:histidine kinase n=1 Tax=Candidatus Moduliflexus flocculans TaxID=1499966 RepID=A0A0S6VPP6_9BACT|nr:two-component sensor histidine kinase [Candidatus Moduliflexus flocculans]
MPQLRSIKHRFYVVAWLLTLVFGIVYFELAVFLNKLSVSSATGQTAALIDKEIQRLQGGFWKLRFWERAVQHQNYPDADQQFGLTLEQIKTSLKALPLESFPGQLSGQIKQISALLTQYENDFARLIQIETDRRLNRTQLDSNHQSLSSAILMNKDVELLKPLLNLDKFLGLYLQNQRESEYKALRMVFEFLQKKLLQSPIMDERIQSYLAKFDNLLQKDFELKNAMSVINTEFDQIGSALMALFTDISQTAEQLSQESLRTGQLLRQTVRQWFIISMALTFVLLLFIMNMIAQKIIKPLRDMSSVVSQIKSGDKTARFVSQARDEIAELGFAFNEMLDTINQHHSHLEELVRARTSELLHTNQQLEWQITERKRAQEDLVASNAELQATVENLRRTQAQLIQSEKMVALGQLIAGVAHEINTPLGAIRSSVESMSQTIGQTLGNLPEFLLTLSPERRHDFSILIHSAIQRDTTLSAKEERKIKRELAKELQNYQLDYAPKIAELLVNLGVYANLHEFIPLLQDPEHAKILDMAYRLSGLYESTGTILTATERASKVVFALKTYARYDHSGEMVSANLADGIETVLTLYHNKIKHGVEVVRNFQSLPPLRCYPDELNQVWTNLIHNALQAMSNKGTLTITISAVFASNCDDERMNGALVSISDSGNGIPDVIRERIFEPFFTTKPAGEGSGLGLDICRKIIEKHQGTITFESQPGKTTFNVFLPVYES